MSRIYSPAEKAAALEQLERNAGNIALTAAQLGISDRTLYSWRQKLWLQQLLLRQNSSPPPQSPIPTFPDDLTRMDYIRTQIMDELVRVADTLKEMPAATTPNQRALVLSHLLDKVMLLDAHLKPYRPKPVTTYTMNDSEGEEPDGDEPDLSESPSHAEGDSQI